MKTLEINQHPTLIIFANKKEDLLRELSLWKRKDLIKWLKWNDPNGVYDDVSSLSEFDNILSKKEAIEIISRQILEG